MSTITILLVSNAVFALLTVIFACKMVALRDDLDIERGCHWITQRALEGMRAEARRLRSSVSTQEENS